MEKYISGPKIEEVNFRAPGSPAAVLFIDSTLRPGSCVLATQLSLIFLYSPARSTPPPRSPALTYRTLSFLLLKEPYSSALAREYEYSTPSPPTLTRRRTRRRRKKKEEEEEGRRRRKKKRKGEQDEEEEEQEEEEEEETEAEDPPR